MRVVLIARLLLNIVKLRLICALRRRKLQKVHLVLLLVLLVKFCHNWKLMI